MAVDPAVIRIVTTYSDRALAVRQQVLAFIQRVWGDLSSWRDADIERFVAAIVPVVTGGQIRIAALTDSYLAAVEAGITGLPVRPVGVPSSLVNDETIRGVTAADVYRRTGPTVWTALSRGVPLTVAAGYGLTRALSMGATDLQLAKTHASRHVLASKGHVAGYRRVLSGGDTCSYCAGAAGRTYGREDLLPIHPGCSCSVIPVIGSAVDVSPDVTVDDRGAATVRQHGELGPVLASADDAFRSEEDLP